MQLLVTVIIPTYNRARTIKRSINSVLEQSYENIELIVVDDCSSDNTVEIVNSYKDERIRLIHLCKHCGANVARNRGICAARGEYIAFQDSDDEWKKNKLEIQLKYMESTDKMACYCSFMEIQCNGRKNILPIHAEDKELYEKNIKDILKKKNVIGTPTLVVRKEVFADVGKFDESFDRWQDYEFVIRLCKYYEIGYVEKPLVNVYEIDDSISSNKEIMLETCKKILIKHGNFLDFKSILYKYMLNCEWYDTKNIYFEYLDDIFQVASNEKHNEMIELYNDTKMLMLRWHTFFSEHIIGKKFAIYGAGVYGREVYYTLKNFGVIPQCFWVSCRNNENNIDKIPVLELPNIIDKQWAVIVAVNKDKQDVMVENLVIKNISNYMIYPFC